MLSSVAVLALAGARASAEQPPANLTFHDWFLSVEGGPLFANPGVSTDSEPPPQLGQDQGGYGAIAFGHGVNADTDWRVKLAYSGFRENDATSSSGSLKSKLAFETADFDVGFHRAVEAADFRFFGGLRLLAENDSADKVGTNSIDSSYFGFGPQIGTDFDFRRMNSLFGVSGTVAGAVVFGQRDSISIPVPGSPSSQSASNTAYNLEGQIALDYHPSSLATFSVGVRAAQWWNVRLSNTDPSLASDPNQLSWGPFVKLTLYAP